jgi:hypothetical protein
MANVKISELPASSTPDADDLVPVVVDGVTSKVSVAVLIKEFPEIVEISAATLDLALTHRGKILKCTHASGCAVTVADSIFAEDDWVQFFGTQDVVTFVEDGCSIEPSASSRDVNVRVELLFLADDSAILNGDIQL